MVGSGVRGRQHEDCWGDNYMRTIMGRKGRQVEIEMEGVAEKECDSVKHWRLGRLISTMQLALCGMSVFASG
jgi:hypothetical protein